MPTGQHNRAEVPSGFYYDVSMARPDLTLVIGATGMLGRPVVRRLVREGFAVRAFVRNRERTLARGLLPRECELVEGDVLDTSSLSSAMAGAAAVYVNLAAPRSPKRLDVERAGVPHIVEAAHASSVEHLLKISFMGVPQAVDLWWQIRHKAESEQLIIDSGIDYTIFHPTWFMESIALFRMGRILVLPRVRPEPIWWIAGDDFARQVAAALARDTARNRCYVIQGPEPLAFPEAAKRFGGAWRPGPLTVSHIPSWVLGAMAPVVADARYLLDLLDVTFETNTTFRAEQTWYDLGTPTMTVEDYARYIDQTGDVPRK